jgi:DNA polymerase-1
MHCFIDGDPLLFIAEWKRTPEEAKAKLDELVVDIPDSVFATSSKIAVKGPNNFRYEVLPNYKGDRNRGEDQEDKLKDLRDHLIEAHGAVVSHGQEADDLLAQWSHQANEAEEPWVIASIDKDLLTIPGVHYNIRKGVIDHISKDRADFLFCQQLLMGDRVDCIPGLAGIGEARSKALLAGSTYPRLDAVKDAYRDVYGSKWKEELQVTADLIYMRREFGVSYTIN